MGRDGMGLGKGRTLDQNSPKFHPTLRFFHRTSHKRCDEGNEGCDECFGDQSIHPTLHFLDRIVYERCDERNEVWDGISANFGRGANSYMAAQHLAADRRFRMLPISLKKVAVHRRFRMVHGARGCTGESYFEIGGRMAQIEQKHKLKK